MKVQKVLLLRVSSATDKVDHPQFFDPCYQLKIIQAGLEQRGGLEVANKDCWIEPMSTDKLDAWAREVQPDLVVINATSFEVREANAFAAALKKWEHPPKIIGIGQGMYLNREWEEGHAELYDAILLGEPEEQFTLLFERMLDDSDDGWRDAYWKHFSEGKRFSVEDLDALPFPTYTRDELYAYRSIYPVRLAKRVLWGFLIAGRGCPYECSFCSEVMRVSVGKKMRIRSGKSVVDEMEHLARQGANIISFQDDSFASSKALVRGVCDEILARGVQIPWMARIRVDEVDYDLLELMKEAGCAMLGMGVEAGSQRIVDRVVKTYKPKPWADIARQTFKWTHELGIGTNAYYVLGNPEETREELQQTVDLALELDADSIQVHFHTPYPGSPDWEKYHSDYDDPTKLFHYAKPLHSVAAVSPDELMEIRSSFYKKYLFRPKFALQHLWHYAGFYLHNPDIFWTLLGIRKIMGKGHDEEPTPEPAAVPQPELQPRAGRPETPVAAGAKERDKAGV